MLWTWIQRLKYVIIWWLTHPPTLLDIIHKKKFPTKAVYEQELVKRLFKAVPRVCNMFNIIKLIFIYLRKVH